MGFKRGKARFLRFFVDVSNVDSVIIAYRATFFKRDFVKMWRAVVLSVCAFMAKNHRRYALVGICGGGGETSTSAKKMNGINYRFNPA